MAQITKIEIERRFLIEYPDLTVLENMPNCDKAEIIQTYLKSGPDDAEIRVRQRGKDGYYIFTETIKKRVSDIKRLETERRLTQTEYLTLLMNADTELKQIRKTRYCLSFADQYLEIDIYPFWMTQAILEVELSDEDQKIVFPDFIKYITEITSDMKYTNRALAENIPEEHCNHCPHCLYEWFQEPGDFIYQSDRYCKIFKENGKPKLLASWCTTGDRTKIPNWCPLKKQ